MIVHIVLTQHDLLEDRCGILAEGSAIRKKNRLVYHERDDEKIIHDIFFSDKEIILKRRADIESTTYLYPAKKGKSVIRSPYGVMELPAVLEFSAMEDDRWTAVYRILSGEDTVTYQKLVWEMKGAAE